MPNLEIPLCQAPPQNATAPQRACYAKACSDYATAVAECIASDGTPEEIQACVNTKNETYLSTLVICDTQ